MNQHATTGGTAPDVPPDTQSDTAPDETTPMFSGAELPVRTGVYRRAWPAGPYSCWGGGRWIGDEAAPAAAAASRHVSRYQDAAWQGLTQPHAPCSTCGGGGVIDLGPAGYNGEDDSDLDFSDCPDC